MPLNVTMVHDKDNITSAWSDDLALNRYIYLIPSMLELKIISIFQFSVNYGTDTVYSKSANSCQSTTGSENMQLLLGLLRTPPETECYWVHAHHLQMLPISSTQVWKRCSFNRWLMCDNGQLCLILWKQIPFSQWISCTWSSMNKSRQCALRT